MRTKIILEDSKKGFINIPLTQKEIHDFYQIGFIIIDSPIAKCLVDNKVLDSFLSIWKKFRFLSSDVIYEGKCYELKDKKMILCKKRYYQIKKPRWRKYET